MIQAVLYKDYSILSTPAYQSDISRWSIQITIVWEFDGVEIDLPFTSDTPYLTETEAAVQGIIFDQHLIDGKVPGLSVEQEPLFLPKEK